VINDLVTDNRVQRTCRVLEEMGYKVTLIGRRLPGSPPVPHWSVRAIRMRMVFTSGPLFYLFFNLRLFLRLLVTRADLLYANDLDTLFPNFLVSRLRRIPLVYDSHELFCEVPELAQSPFKRKVWSTLEKWLLPRVPHRITVNESIAGIFLEKYGTRFSVVRNIGRADEPMHLKSRADLGLPNDKKVLLLQGAGINIHRGAEELVEAMKLVNDWFLLIVGAGDVWPYLQKATAGSANIRLVKRQPPGELRHYTRNADLGISIDKSTNPNYFNSLPNKIFDYTSAGLPVLATRLPEVERVLGECGSGVFINNHEPSHIASVINGITEEELSRLKKNALSCRDKFSWDNEKKVLQAVIAQAGGAV
jgi:glycosyltransferase involved in cell wall biosynthesis